MKPERTLFNFTSNHGTCAWESVNDRIMGGRSTGVLTTSSEGYARFTGFVSLKKNGGFASIRSLPDPVDLSASEGLRLNVRGDGKRYKFSIRTDPYSDGVSYQASFHPLHDRWENIELPFRTFLPTFRGRILRDEKPLDTRAIWSFGIIIADRQRGDFRLDISALAAFG